MDRIAGIQDRSTSEVTRQLLATTRFVPMVDWVSQGREQSVENLVGILNTMRYEWAMISGGTYNTNIRVVDMPGMHGLFVSFIEDPAGYQIHDERVRIARGRKSG